MYFVILGRDRPGTAAGRAEARPAHLARLEGLKHEGRLLLAGPLPRPDAPEQAPPEMIGSLIVAEFPSLREARDWASLDPYVAAGVYGEVEVLPFRKVLP
jgi:uncharacterized protein YciI